MAAHDLPSSSDADEIAEALLGLVVMAAVLRGYLQVVMSQTMPAPMLDLETLATSVASLLDNVRGSAALRRCAGAPEPDRPLSQPPHPARANRAIT
jgi:hypothetical protein